MEQLGKTLVLRPAQGVSPSETTNTTVTNPFTIHFSQNEELFLKSPEEFEVPSFPIHHDVQIKQANPTYTQKINGIVGQITKLFPGIIDGLTWYFDPTEHLRISFFALYKIDNQAYMYLLRIDLAPRRANITILREGTNDTTPAYKTSKLFLEAELIPLEQIQKQDAVLFCTPKQVVSDTWVGESGRGYFVQGIWIDRELTKFFSKLFSPDKKRLYPYYPLNCKYRSICASLIQFDLPSRRRFLSYLHNARIFLENHVKAIEKTLHSQVFSENLPEFVNLKAKQEHVGLCNELNTFEVKAYLNPEDMKEYEITIGA